MTKKPCPSTTHNFDISETGKCPVCKHVAWSKND